VMAPILDLSQFMVGRLVGKEYWGRMRMNDRVR
jgi:hypothetical protein